jgi:hypothetical protein
MRSGAGRGASVIIRGKIDATEIATLECGHGSRAAGEIVTSPLPAGEGAGLARVAGSEGRIYLPSASECRLRRRSVGAEGKRGGEPAPRLVPFTAVAAPIVAGEQPRSRGHFSRARFHGSLLRKQRPTDGRARWGDPLPKRLASVARSRPVAPLPSPSSPCQKALIIIR